MCGVRLGTKVSSLQIPSLNLVLMRQGRVVIGDEMLTPDSSRFWPREGYEAGKGQPSYDKQFVRDWLKQNPDSDYNLPEEVIDKTVAKYKEAYEQLTGEEFNY